MTAAKNLRSEALGLPRKERAGLARELLESLDSPPDEGAEEAWIDEAERRVAEVDSGQVELEDWDVVRERISARLRAIRA